MAEQPVFRAPEGGPDWDAYRALLSPCRCGSTELTFQAWGMLSGAHVWCRTCGAGTPSDTHENQRALIVHAGDGQDTLRMAAEAWNRWVAAAAEATT